MSTVASGALAPPSPPQAMAPTDDPEAVDAALRRVASKSRSRLFSSFSNLRFKRRSPEPRVGEPANTCVRTPPRSGEETRSIVLDASNLSDVSRDRDVYRWAILYENQRGLTIFSSQYYSSLSLLPSDPFPFTLPWASTRRFHQPNVSLISYPFPDGTWRWVSKSWMIDMRTDLGQVQHDGFEYNWSFRETNWRAEIGAFSAGAWVRRRRWVRLMMRPARRTEPNNLPTSPGHSLEHEASQVWQGNPEEDWVRCRRLLRRVKQDGYKLELWRMWLEPQEVVREAKGKGKQREEGDSLQSNLTEMLHNHADDVLGSFVFPDSRAQFLRLLRRVGLLDGPGAVLDGAEADFWSYHSGLAL